MRKNIYWATGLTCLYLLLDISLARQVTWIDTLFSIGFSFAGFLLFSVFCSSLCIYIYIYRLFTYIIPLISLLALLPVLNFFYYKTYTEFITYPFLQILLREPFFLLTTLGMQILPYIGYVLPALAVWCIVTHQLLRPLFIRQTPAYKPFAVYTHIIPAVLLPALLIGCYLTLPSLYKISVCAAILTAAIVLPFLWFVWKTSLKPVRWAVGICCCILILGKVLSYKTDVLHLRLDAATLITAADTLYMPATPNDMSQSPDTQAQYQQRPVPNIPFNVLIIINDAMRARNLGVYGYTERYPDQALQPFYQKSTVFQYALSPAHYTTISIGQMFTGQGANRKPKQIKEARRLWDYAPADFFTFYVFSANKQWGNLDKFISSLHMDHLWSFAQEDDDFGSLLEMMDDAPAIKHVQEIITEHPRHYIGVLHTNNTHFPFYQNPAVIPYYRPCSSSVRSGWPQSSINCYDNAIRHVSNQEAALLESIDLSNTLVVITADHGQQFKEHGGYFYAALYDENIHVPFIWYIPPAIQQKIPAENWKLFKENTHYYVSNIDMLPTILHIAALVTQDSSIYREQDFSGRSLLTPRKNDVIVSSGCFMDWACVKRETVFADDNYYILLKPNQHHPLEIYLARDTAQQEPLSPQDISPDQLQNIYDKAPDVHPLGTFLLMLLEKQFPQLATHQPTH